MTTTTYHRRLRAARIEAGLDQAQLADRIGSSTSTISAVERGQRDIAASKLFAWVRACGASLDHIAGESVLVPAAVDPSLVELELEDVHA